jgi:transcriptional regulator GlxA family with amidase domain
MFLSEMSNPIVGARAATEALMKLCLVTIVRQQNAELRSSPFLMGLRDRKLAGAIAEMVDRPGDPHSIESLALAAGMCRSLFADQFRAVFGTSPIDFLQGIRLALAHDLLATTDLPVKRITQVIGLRSRSNFSRAFRERYQIDPTGFRAAAKDKNRAGMSL